MEVAGLRDLAELDQQELAHGVEVYSWLRRSSSERYVVEKERLTVFWAQTHGDKTAAEILDGE